MLQSTLSSSGDQQKPCFCRTFRCNGALKPLSTLYQHRAQDYKLIQESLQVKSTEDLHSDSRCANASKYWPNPDDHVPLFEGSSETLVGSIAKEIAHFVDNNGVSKTALSENLKKLKGHLPQPNNLPEKYYQAKAIIGKYLLPVTTFDSGVNDCLVF